MRPDEQVIIARFMLAFDLLGTFVFALSGAAAGIVGDGVLPEFHARKAIADRKFPTWTDFALSD